MKTHDINGDTEKLIKRFVGAFLIRGFKNFDQCAGFLRQTVPILKPMSDHGIVNCLGKKPIRDQIATALGLVPVWLGNGREPKFIMSHPAWYNFNKKSLPSDGPTPHMCGAPNNKLLSDYYYKVLPLMGSQYALVMSKVYSHALTVSRLTKEEQAAIDGVWDPSELSRNLLRCGRIAEGNHDLPRHDIYQQTVIDLARLCWCLAVDHDRGHQVNLTEARNKLAWHDDCGVFLLVEKNPNVPVHVVERYEAILIAGKKLIEQIEIELQISNMATKPHSQSKRQIISANLK